MKLYLVTGSIRPDFVPVLFTSKRRAKRYKAHIDTFKTDLRIKPVIEVRSSDDMRRGSQSTEFELPHAIKKSVAPLHLKLVTDNRWIW